jgi:hypothetical protein
MPVIQIAALRDRRTMGAFVAVYVAVRILGSVAETQWVNGTGFSPWNVMSALDIIFF